MKHLRDSGINGSGQRRRLKTPAFTKGSRSTDSPERLLTGCP